MEVWGTLKSSVLIYTVIGFPILYTNQFFFWRIQSMDTLNVEEVGEFSGDKPTVERRGRPARQLKDDIYSYGPTNSCKWKYNSYNSGYISSIKYWGVLSNVLVNQSNDTKTYTHQTYSGWWFGTLFFDFPFSWECHHPNWRTPSFFRGVGIPTTNQHI